MDNIRRLEEQANVLFENLAGWENSSLQRIGKRIRKYGKMSVADVKAINNIAVVKQDMKEITKDLAKITGLNISQIEKIYGDALATQHLANKPLYDYRNVKFVPFSENKELQSIVRAYARATAGTMLNLSKTKALCLRDVRGRFVKMQKGYTDILDWAVMQVTTGVTDFHTAMRESIKQLGGGGINVDYGGGIARRLDTVVRQNLLWGAKQASVEYQKVVGEELGCDGIEIDWHSNPRPSHVFMQGRQFCNGKSRTINGVFFQGADEVDPTSLEGQSCRQALNDFGCLHFPTTIICGVSEPTYSKEELDRLNKQNEKEHTIGNKTQNGYGWQQDMRKLETEIRKQKDIKAVAQASGDKELVKQCDERIKACKDKYNEISEVTGIAKDPKRMSITKSGNVLTNASDGIIMKKDAELQLSRYVNSNDKLYSYAKNIPPIDGYEDQVIHGDKFGFEIRDLNDNTAATYTPKEFAEILKEDPNYHGGNIRLISCDVGAEDATAAQELADLLGVDVLAPNDVVIVYPDGTMKVGYDGKGKWILYKKR